MIGYKPVLTPGSERYVHHMMMYECHDDVDSKARFHHHVNSGYECNAPNMPNDFKKCKGIVAAWGLGGEPFFFPEQAGYPVGEEHGGATYYMFEVINYILLKEFPIIHLRNAISIMNHLFAYEVLYQF